MPRKRLIHRGIRHDRTLIEDDIGRREKVFAEAWIEENKPQQYSMYGKPCSRLEALMAKDDKFIPVSQETAVAVATIIQWLATNVGGAFLDTALKKAGYRVVPIEKK